ncbi:hypothetical protein B5S28_g4238 [[Candida] boidinii]|uniref:Unnamed protein product n=1 Tax=Candida boidinii TaxID=5477 RepID=A0ACB5TL19_CANBO|nr:hypothetical protein B5S28_g4238 [[Candida] boidinii]OWB63558.1 hypothetical protein B5S29_g4547 [[Candida] boidinii]GME90405.1 unnamed protein product [[Candida] boidinii]
MLSAVRIKAPKKPTAIMIMMHGLGDSGENYQFFSDLFHRQEEFKQISFIFPNAPIQPVSINNGFPMPSWFDILQLGQGLDPNTSSPTGEMKFDANSFWDSYKKVEQLIKYESETTGIPYNRIVIGGFSQGGALALATGAFFKEKLAGILSLSSSFPINSKEYLSEKYEILDINKSTNFFQGHGDMDQVIPSKFGKLTSDAFKDNGFKNYNFKEYIGLDHGMSNEELKDVSNFLSKTLPPI